MKVDGSLKSLLQGVSQQPPRERLPGQCTLQENMSSDPITGLTRRPPTDMVGYLGSGTTIQGWHDFETKDGGKYLSFWRDGAVKVFDLNADEQVVTYETDAQAYLTGATSLRAHTIETENETYVVNRDKVPAFTATLPSYLSNGEGVAMIQVLGGGYSKTYSVALDGVEILSFTTHDGSAADEAAYVGTKLLAHVIEWLLTHTDITGFPSDATAVVLDVTSSAALSNTAAWEVIRFEDYLFIRNKAGTQFSLSISDDAGNKNVKYMTNQVGAVEDLPRLAPHLYVCRIAEKTDPAEDLWFKFLVEGEEDNLTPSTALFGKSGYWQEAVAPGTKIRLDATTMPHVLEYRETEADFHFRKEAWVDRKVGTDVSNPDPSFVGNAIKDVSSFQGRLAFVSGASVCLSRSNRNKDFFFGSLSAQAATDPIDVHSKVETGAMLAAVQHNRDMVVFSTKGQFVLYGKNLLTPENAALVMTSAFEASLVAKPVAAGRNVFFATNYGTFSGMREFYTEGAGEINDSRPITQHVKKYLRGTVSNLAATSNYDTLVVQTDTSGRDAYVYQYIWADADKVQSAWHTWKITHNIVHTFFDEELLYLVQQVGNDFYLLRMSLDVQDTAGVPYPVHLDQRFDVFDCYTQFLLPYDYMATDDLIVVQGTDCPTPGLIAPIQSVEFNAGEGGYVVTLRKNMNGGQVLVGTPFLSRYQPTMPVVKDADGVGIATAKLIISKFMASLAATGRIVGKVLSRYGDSQPVEYTGRIVGSADNVVGTQPLTDSTFHMPFRQNAALAEVEFYADDHLPMTILDIEWAGQFTKRGRRMSTGG